ncbi:MAG: hypothetical protein AB7G87_13555 [Clostridia bacterium]
MKILTGQVICDENVVRVAQMAYNDTKGFFVALVNICDQLDVDIPIWTSMEDKLLDRKGDVLLPLEQGVILRISRTLTEGYIQ